MKEILEKTSSDSCGCGHDHHDVHDHVEHAHEEHHHHEHNDEHCGCGCEDHEHEHHHHHEHVNDHCGCGCEDHEHEHEHHHHDHDDHCGCGCEGHEHEHDHHHHHHNEHCACGCEDHEHEHGHHHPHSTASAKRVYILENLGCAHCASKMEEQIQHLDGVESATITFATKQLRLNAADPDALLPQIRKICTSIESEVKVVPRNPKPSASADVTTRIYLLENLGCAHCASKMEEQIADLDGISEATITFATRQLRVTAKNPDRYLDQIRRICTSIESEVIVKEKDPRPKAQAATSETHAASTKRTFSKEKIDTICIIIGAILFVAGEIMEHKGFSDTATLPVFVIAYLALGGVIVVKAAKNISHGQIFDENFLMSIATLAAFAINDSAEAVGVMLFYRIGELFEEKAVERSRGQIMDAVDLRPEVVNLVAGDNVQVIPSEDAQVGDVLLVRPGDRIPLDGVIIEGSSRIDTSPITGEPVPVAVNEGDEITSGCVNTSGQLKIRVEKPLGESMVTRILDSVENAAASKPKIDRFITRFAKVYTPCVVGIAVATALIPSLVIGNWHYWIYTAITFLVMSCPCALVLSIPLAFFSGIGAGSKKESCSKAAFLLKD